jgi:hypothetical protein
MRTRVRSSRAFEFACHSKACAPPPAGTGGSNPKGGGAGGGISLQDALNKRFGGGGGSLTPREDERDAAEAESRAKAKAASAGGTTVLINHTHPDHKSRKASDVGAMSQDEALKLIRDNDATGRRILDKGVEVQDGQPVGVRANLNVKKTTGVTVQTIHAGTEGQLEKGTGMFGGEAIGYGAAVTLRDVNFSVNQEARAKILSKETNKFPMASVDGHFVSPDKVAEKAKYNLSEFDGMEVRFNPMTSHLFTDPNGRAIKSASEATVVGSQVFVRGTVTYYGEDDMPKPARGLPTIAHP